MNMSKKTKMATIRLKRQLPMGFPPVMLDKGGTVESPTTATMTTIAMRGSFAPRRLFITSSRLGAVIVQDFTVNEESQLVSSDPIPTEMFSPLSFGSDMNCDTAKVGDPVKLRLGNIGKKKVTVTAGMIGVTEWTMRGELVSVEKEKKGKKGA